jgi:hypothetical protein
MLALHAAAVYLGLRSSFFVLLSSIFVLRTAEALEKSRGEEMPRTVTDGTVHPFPGPVTAMGPL